jgi:hypothetical protein
MNVQHALAAIPAGLRASLLSEYQSIIQNYAEHRWAPSELSGGKFCEIVYSILDGHAKGQYPGAPSKPANFVAACRGLEQNAHCPRSFQILIPRLLPSLYEIRNNRGVGHVGGDIDPNKMDAAFVVSSCNWIMAELVRVYHQLTPEDAQRLVDTISERKTPLVWDGDDVRRVLKPAMSLRSQTIVLLATSPSGRVATNDLFRWTGHGNRTYFTKILRTMHAERLIELSQDQSVAQILPPGSSEAAEIIRQEVDGVTRTVRA